jgi:hypothetical protein
VTTTTTIEPLPCATSPRASWEGLTCRLAVLQATTDAFADDAFGGPKKSGSLTRHVVRAQRMATVAATSRKPLRLLRRLARELRRFHALIAWAERHGTIATDVAAVLRAASAEVTAAADGLGAAR